MSPGATPAACAAGAIMANAQTWTILIIFSTLSGVRMPSVCKLFEAE
jgi:hypothetical protein